MKRLPAALAELDPALGDRFADAFAALFRTADPAPVLALADTILAQHGGRPGDTFRIASPPSWRDGPEALHRPEWLRRAAASPI